MQKNVFLKRDTIMVPVERIASGVDVSRFFLRSVVHNCSPILTNSFPDQLVFAERPRPIRVPFCQLSIVNDDATPTKK